MKIVTKLFGEIDTDMCRVITFENGILGFPDLKHFTLLHDVDQGNEVGIRFLQSIEEPAFAMPVMNPLVVKPDYDPIVNDDLLKPVGNLTADNVLALVTVTVPSDLTQMRVNLQGPIIINADELKGCQIIVENPDYPTKFFIYDILKNGKAGE